MASVMCERYQPSSISTNYARDEQLGPPIAPEHHTVKHRLFYHMNDARVALMSFREVLEPNDPVLIPIFERLKDDYRTGSLAQSEMDAQMTRV